MTTQVISVHGDGRTASLDHKKEGLDLRKLGAPVDVKRTSLILWSHVEQAWWIELQHYKPVHDGKRAVRMDMIKEYALSKELASVPHRRCYDDTPTNHLIMFEDYDDATSFEVTLVSAIRCTMGGDYV